MKAGIITGAAMALMLCSTVLAQDCGCGPTGAYYGHGHYGGHHGLFHIGHGCHRAWTYDQALSLWDGYCHEEPYDQGCGHGGLFGGGFGCGCGAGGGHCGSRWPAGDCCSSDACGSGCGLNFCLGLRRGCGGGLLSGRGCGGCGGFGWGQGCGCDTGCDDGCGCGGHHHGIDLFGGLRGRLGGGLFAGFGHCDAGCGCDAGHGCDAGPVRPGCGCN